MLESSGGPMAAMLATLMMVQGQEENVPAEGEAGKVLAGEKASPRNLAVPEEGAETPGPPVARMVETCEDSERWWVERARERLASVENRAARAMAHMRRVIDDEVESRVTRAMALARRVIDDEVDRMRSLRLVRPDVDAKQRSLQFLDTSRESTFDAAARVVRWLRREAEMLSLGFSDGESEASSGEDLSDNESAEERRSEEPSTTARDALCEAPAKLLHRVYVHVGDVVDLARAAVVCRAFRERTHRGRAGRPVWKWTCRFGAAPATGTKKCAGFWLALAAEARDQFALTSAPFDDLDVLAGSVAQAARGSDEEPGPWTQQIALDAARTPLARLWRGIGVPNVGARTTFDAADASVLRPYRDVVAKVCGQVAAARPRLGYCQGIDYVVAYALRATLLDAVAAADLVSSLLDSFDLAGLFEPGLPGLKRRCLELTLLLEARCPNLARHLNSRGVHIELFAAAWIQTLFVYVDALPLRVLDRAWTLLLFERTWKPMHRLSLAIFATLEPHILQHCAAPHDVLVFVSGLTSPDRINRPQKKKKKRRGIVNANEPVDAPDLLGDGSPDDGRELVRLFCVSPGDAATPRSQLHRAMNIKVTNSMLNRIGANELLPRPLRARSSLDDNQQQPVLVTIAE